MTDLRTLADRDCIGIVIVDHGSHRAESNRRHEDFVAEWKLRSGYTIVEAAHMELAEPSIGTAFDACVAAGATTIVVAPYLLWPGNHWERDIPALAAEASTRHRDVAFLVTAPLGPHPLLMTIVDDRIRYCVAHATGEEPECAICRGHRTLPTSLSEAAPRRRSGPRPHAGFVALQGPDESFEARGRLDADPGEQRDILLAEPATRCRIERAARPASSG